MLTRRRYPRIEVNAGSRVLIQSHQSDAPELRIFNICVDGAGLLSPALLGEIDDRIEVAFLLTPGKLRFKTGCRIRCVLGNQLVSGNANDHWLHGMYFQEITPQARLALEEYIQSRLSKCA